jgi:lipopolysaccharide/colanic/teichoic acid biosynthesis glycosyltransferase
MEEAGRMKEQNLTAPAQAPGRTRGSRTLYRAVKRVFDIAFSGAVLAVGLVPGAILSAFIVRDTHGSPLYTQERIGLDGKPFRIFKFRTMVSDSDDVEKYLDGEQLRQWTIERKVDDDPRITRLGSVLRRTSLDEIPNFINVFIGQMSTVGPRAITGEELVHYGELRDALLSVKPGVTGWWQVKDRNDATFESGERQRLELYYVENASVGLDAKIICSTLGVMAGRNKTGR